MEVVYYHFTHDYINIHKPGLQFTIHDAVNIIKVHLPLGPAVLNDIHEPLFHVLTPFCTIVAVFVFLPAAKQSHVKWAIFCIDNVGLFFWAQQMMTSSWPLR